MIKFKKNTTYLVILFIVVLISSLIGFKSLNPSKPNYDDLSRVNVVNQMKHIKEIAKEPHSIFDFEAKGKVRDYLISEFDKLGVKSTIYEYEDVFIERSNSNEDLQNIYAEIKGKSDSYIMLVTHYDSSKAKVERYAEKDGSLGAADAGYGLSTILETIRVIKENNIQLENGIKILITDGEEYGLLGAKEAVKESEIFKGVDLLINLEARGTKGPAIMFETSPNNSSIVDLYKTSYKPFSYSITPEIYRLLPNGTDFTVFLENSIPGINISVLDGLENYHTPNDNPNNLSEASMQHYGDQVLPIVTEFVSNIKYSDSNALKSTEDSIFFNLGSFFIKYSKTTNYILLFIILISIVILYKTLNIKRVGKISKYILVNILFTIGTMALTYAITRIVALVNGRTFKLTYLPLMKFEGTIILAVIILAFIVYFFTIRKISNNFKENNEFLVGSLILLLILSIIFTVLLPGGSYLTVFPAVLISLCALTKSIFNKHIHTSLIMLIPISLTIILFLPTIYLFNAALTFGGFSAYMLFIMIGFIAILSSTMSINGITQNI